MAHELDYNTKLNRHAMFSVKEKPWHGLGVVVDNVLTSKEAIIQAGLDYKVIKAPHYVDVRYGDVLNGVKAKIPCMQDTITRVNNDNKLVIPVEALENRLYKSPYAFSTVRTDRNEILGHVGADYKIFQNSDAFTFFDEIVGSKEAIFETAGAMFNGAKIFITAKLPNTIEVIKGDIVDQYLLLSNSHDGSTQIEVMFTPIRVVCNNTLMAALSSSTIKYKVKHTANAKNRLNKAQEILGITKINTKLANEFFTALAAKQVDDKQSATLIKTCLASNEELLRLKRGEPFRKVFSTMKLNIYNDVVAYYHTGAGQDINGVKGTLWGVYNALTGYYQNVKQYKTKDDKMESMFYQDGFRKNIKFVDHFQDALQTF